LFLIFLLVSLQFLVFFLVSLGLFYFLIDFLSPSLLQHDDGHRVRDNVYSILSIWGLALAYRKIDDDDGRTYELEQVRN
jgi:hypothetical protein